MSDSRTGNVPAGGESHPAPQVAVLDAGGQYCHLIARKVREQGVYAEVFASDTPAAELSSCRAIIISGGPDSVYAPGSPTVDPAIFKTGQPVLGICYGLQLMALLLGGQVAKGEKGEYGLAMLDVISPGVLFDGIGVPQQVWMSHRDRMTAMPPGFELLATTSTCAMAAMGDRSRRLYGVQFHPEVVHTHKGRELLSNFLFSIAGCVKDWSPRGRVAQLEQFIRETAAGRNVFFFVSGGVDSSVAYSLCLRALGADRVHGVYVDTGLMREGETEFVEKVFARQASGTFAVERAADSFLGALASVSDPEQKRLIIGEQFVRIQEQILQSGNYLDGNWILGQGTIYPDTIESGGTANADVIKTHHNRVPGIQRLLADGRIIEPLTSFYKDEVREIGRELGLPEQLLARHPFPGPGLAIRCLASESTLPVESVAGGWIIPVRSVGVQGDSRSYRHVLALDSFPSRQADLQARAAEMINATAGVNRAVALVASHASIGQFSVRESTLSEDRLARLRRADAIVRGVSAASGFENQVWQFPVVLIPVGQPSRPDSVVLRPVDSVDGMTAQSVAMEDGLLKDLADKLLQVPGVAAVFYDLTHKPPGTIEWE
ncbi:MAG: glutamine-hydrolyzing GMP synthase [Acidobacteriales bacterium]|nr:glutamine-hydrolyzing GMP synthase [Terriglobales bacterium]